MTENKSASVNGIFSKHVFEPRDRNLHLRSSTYYVICLLRVRGIINFFMRCWCKLGVFLHNSRSLPEARLQARTFCRQVSISERKNNFCRQKQFCVLIIQFRSGFRMCEKIKQSRSCDTIATKHWGNDKSNGNARCISRTNDRYVALKVIFNKSF